MRVDKMQETKASRKSPHKPLDAFEPVPGVYVQSQTSMEGYTRLIFTGPNVEDGLRHKISQWLRADQS